MTTPRSSPWRRISNGAPGVGSTSASSASPPAAAAPAAPLLIGRYGLDLGVVISASHNPYRDNGIKFFAADGFKLSDEDEAAIEARLEELMAGAAARLGRGAGGEATRSGARGVAEGGEATRSGARGADEGGEATPSQAGGVAAGGGARPGGGRIGRVRALHGTQEDYLRALHERFADLDLTGLDVVLDCAHGATYRAAPEIFRRLGAAVTALNDAPDGRNINDGCGSTHVEALAAAVVGGGHDVGFAFDGDGDRVLAVDRNGVVVDGDELIALATLHLRDLGRLPGDGVAVTVMTNYGFHAAMREAGVAVATTAVGDRYVLEALRERGWALGGEQSGHIIDMGFNATGDGIASALLTLEALRGGDLAERDAMHKLPQKLVNVPVADRDAAMASPQLAEAGAREQQALEGRGRVLVRPSGTEQLVRVMVEAPSAEEADAVCERLVALVSELSA